MTPAEELIIVSDLMAKISRKLDSVSAENADLRAKLAEAVMLAGSYRNRKRSRNRKMIGGG